MQQPCITTRVSKEGNIPSLIFCRPSSLSLHWPGLMVLERNWLDVYPYTNWGSAANLPPFQEGQTFMPHELELRQVSTAAAAAGPGAAAPVTAAASAAVAA
jgi:hypothetical protein